MSNRVRLVSILSIGEIANNRLFVSIVILDRFVPRSQTVDTDVKYCLYVMMLSDKIVNNSTHPQQDAVVDTSTRTFTA